MYTYSKEQTLQVSTIWMIPLAHQGRVLLQFKIIVVLTQDTTTVQINDFTTVTLSPASNSGTWTNGGNAQTDGSGAATSASVNQAQKYGSYGSIPANAIITDVWIRMDAWSSYSGGSGSSNRDRILLEVSVDGGANSQPDDDRLSH